MFFGFLWYFWFSRRFCWFCKNLRENQKNKKKTYPRVSLKPLNTLFVWLFLMFCWFSLVFFCICGYLEGFVGFVKTFGKTTKNKETKNISKGESETFKNLVLFVVPNVCLVFFGFLLYVWFSRGIFWFCKNLRENQTNKKQHIQG